VSGHLMTGIERFDLRRIDAGVTVQEAGIQMEGRFESVCIENVHKTPVEHSAVIVAEGDDFFGAVLEAVKFDHGHVTPFLHKI